MPVFRQPVFRALPEGQRVSVQRSLAAGEAHQRASASPAHMQSEVAPAGLVPVFRTADRNALGYVEDGQMHPGRAGRVSGPVNPRLLHPYSLPLLPFGFSSKPHLSHVPHSLKLCCCWPGVLKRSLTSIRRLPDSLSVCLALA